MKTAWLFRSNKWHWHNIHFLSMHQSFGSPSQSYHLFWHHSFFNKSLIAINSSQTFPCSIHLDFYIFEWVFVSFAKTETKSKCATFLYLKLYSNLFSIEVTFLTVYFCSIYRRLTKFQSECSLLFEKNNCPCNFSCIFGKFTFILLHMPLYWANLIAWRELLSVWSCITSQCLGNFLIFSVLHKSDDTYICEFWANLNFITLIVCFPSWYVLQWPKYLRCYWSKYPKSHNGTINVNSA